MPPSTRTSPLARSRSSTRSIRSRLSERPSVQATSPERWPLPTTRTRSPATAARSSAATITGGACRAARSPRARSARRQPNCATCDRAYARTDPGATRDLRCAARRAIRSDRLLRAPRAAPPGETPAARRRPARRPAATRRPRRDPRGPRRSRARSRARAPCRRRCARGRRRRGGSGRRRARAARPGSRDRRRRPRSPPGPRATLASPHEPARAGVLHRVAYEVAHACARRSRSARSVAVGRRRARSGVRRQPQRGEQFLTNGRARPSPGAGARPRRRARAAGDPRSAASSARPRFARAVTRRTSSRVSSVWRASTSSCPRIAVSGVRSSCEASATKPRWRAKASSRRSSMWSKASASTRISLRGPRRVDPGREVAGVDGRRSRHPPQRARSRAASRKPSHERREQCHRPPRTARHAVERARSARAARRRRSSAARCPAG